MLIESIKFSLRIIPNGLNIIDTLWKNVRNATTAEPRTFYLSLKTIIIISRFSFLQFRAPKGNLINTQNK